MIDTFTTIYKHNLWSGRESRSGTGSDLVETETIRKELPKLFKKLNSRSVLDIPCGDYWWFKEMKLDIDYIGADIVPDIIEDNKEKYPDVDFRVLDITKDDLPKADVILVRDLLGHLSDEDIKKSLDNISKQETFLVTTHFPGAPRGDIETGSWRPINMEHYLGKPLSIVEEGLYGKTLALFMVGV